MKNRFELPEQAPFTIEEEIRRLEEENERLRGELEAEKEGKGFLEPVWGLAMVVWIVSAWLVILGVLLSFASIVFLVGEWEDRRQRKRALKGLLRILDVEMAGNECLLRIFDEHPECITRASVRSLQTKAWEEGKIALTLLLKKDKHFDNIASYYEEIQAIERDRENKVQPSEEEHFQSLETRPREDAENFEEHEHERVAKQVRLLLEMSDTVRGHTRKHGCFSKNAT